MTTLTHGTVQTAIGTPLCLLFGLRLREYFQTNAGLFYIERQANKRMFYPFKEVTEVNVV